MSNILDGKGTSDKILDELKTSSEELLAVAGVSPGLAVIIVGNRPDSMTYVRMKKKACERAGFVSYIHELPDTATENDIITLVRQLNNDPKVHGFLVQLPLPPSLASSQQLILDTIRPDKDVDGIHPHNVGSLLLKGPEQALFVPCTPLGIMELLKRYNVDVCGKHAVVIGCSNIVGKPIAQLLLFNRATVTICHSRTRDIASFVRQADILVVAIGSPRFVKAEWIKRDAVVIDVGINAIEDLSKKSGYRLVGDVDFEPAKLVASLITPVPKGTGPMTIAMLMFNTLRSARRFVGPQLAAAAKQAAERKLAIAAEREAHIAAAQAAVDKILQSNWDEPEPEDAPIEESPIEDAPIEESPIEDAPIEDAHIEESPIEDAPIEESPIEDAPIEESPIEESSIEDAPIEESPIEDAPIEDAPIEESPIEESPIEDAPIEESPIEESPIEDAPIEESPIEESPIEDAHAPIEDNASGQIQDVEPTIANENASAVEDSPDI